MVQPTRGGHPAGAQLSGELRFELLAEIAVGNTARVELCRVSEGQHAGSLCAVKRLHVHVAEDPAFVDMFRDEVWMTAALKNEHVVQVLGWGNDAQGPWLAVELVRGVSLARLMKTVFETGEMFTERMVVFLARCICEGLAEAHSLRSGAGDHLNLVHRDLTPGNVLLGFAGEVKITDFGLAKAKQRLTRTLTGLLKGNPQYMSPEQVQNRPLDGRSDIFAVGVLLFELFSGRRPWSAGTDLDVMRAVTDERPADLMELRPRMDRALVEIVERCLEKDPSHRFQSAHELGSRLDGWLTAHGYREANENALGRFVRRNAMRQMRWFERAVAGEFASQVQADQAVMAHNRLDAARNDEDIQARDPNLDWGEEGPTLIQRGQQAQQLIQMLAPQTPRSRAAIADATTQRQTVKRPPVAEALRGPELESVTPSTQRPLDSSQLTTVPGVQKQASVVPAAPTEDLPDADATVQLAEGRELVRSMLDDRLGVVAPEDPEVPPVPQRGADPDGTQTVVSTSPTSMRPDGGKDPSLLRTMPVIKSGPEGTQATVPFPAPPDGDLARSFDPQMPLTPPHGAPASFDNSLGLALSEPPPSRANDFHGESRRLAAAAAVAAERAQRTTELAAAAARAAKLADQAVALAGRGLNSDALERLGEAQRIEQLVAKGEIPERRTLLSDRLVGSVDPWLERRMAIVKGSLQQKRIVTVAVIVASLVLLIVVLIASLSS
jgi:serine/threonine-protein kinase